MLFAHKLALQIGEWNVDAMLAKMPSAVFARWFAFGELCPWGGDIENHRAGMLAAATVNWAGQTLKEGSPRAKPSDFFPVPGLEAEEPADAGDPLAELAAIAAAQNGVA